MAEYGYDLRDYRVEMFTDSTIVRNRVGGQNAIRKTEPQQRMFNLAAKCVGKLVKFGGWKISWRGREANVARFGH